ncbi:PE-PPE domain-containing protein [Mycolicibacter heraklionensis]|uniref:PE-PPE domain-containing protein n=2 Tax=Mycolicibacter heraklionensis TaxID=512402 RepID=A0A9X7WGB8_9MYCO|nr:PE-PPE domain-containing protein [Mycolicibacter heraklionensis]
MIRRAVRWPEVVAPMLATAVGISAAISPGATTGVITVLAEADLLSTEAWIMGGSGDPIPSAGGMAALMHRYVDPATPFFAGQPQFPVDATHSLFTPEGLYPLTGIKVLELDPSVTQGLTILDSTIKGQIAAGNNLVVVGVSQSSVISALQMRDLLALPLGEQPTADQLSFVLLGNESNPNGGLLSRFGDPSLPPLSIPSLGITFSGAEPADTPWATAIYTAEYDGFADFPRYPINLLSDINALLGIAFVHTSYGSLTAEQLAATVELPVTDDYTGATRYFMIPTENLPLLVPLRAIPVLGDPLADLLQPALRVLVNLGYGSIDEGWDHGPANVSTPFALFPTDINPADVFTALVNGAQQGVQDFIHDLESLSLPTIVNEIANGNATDSLPSLLDIVNTFSGVLSSAYSGLLPTADVINALLTSLPAYDISLFIQELMSGDLLDAIGLPIAATVGLGSLAGMVEIGAVLQAISPLLGIGEPADLLPLF